MHRKAMVEAARAEVDGLSDEELKVRVDANIAEFIESGGFEGRVAEMIRGWSSRPRTSGRPPITDEVFEFMVQKEIERTLPWLIESRRASGATGPVTDEEFQLIRLQGSRASIGAHGALMQAASERATDPRKQRILAMLAEHAQAYLDDSEVYLDGGVTKEKVSSVSEGIHERSKAMLKLVTGGLSEP